MKLNDQLVATILVSISIICSFTVLATADVQLPSLSAFALSDNARWYRAMHLAAAGFFLVDAQKHQSSYIIAISMAGILIFDMYNDYWLHLVFTVGTILGACSSIIWNTTGFERNIAIFLSSIAIAIFAVGYWVESFHFALAEIIVIACIMCGKLRQIWQKNKLQSEESEIKW